jgi:predicted RNA binding protein YcfA (HicA-like mRNA interferase family)
MAKARQLRAALVRLGWMEVSMVGSHRKFRKGSQVLIFAHHDSHEVGPPMLARWAKRLGITLAELRRLL